MSHYKDLNIFLRREFDTAAQHSGWLGKELRRMGDVNNFEMFVLMNLAWGSWNTDVWKSKQRDNPHDRFMFDDFCETLHTDGITDIWKELKGDHIGYDKLVASCDVTIRKNADFNIIIPVRGRFPHLKTFLKHVNQLQGYLQNWCITVIFQEEDKKFYEEIKAMNICYVNVIHLPHDALNNRFEKNMNRSLCYNVASKIVKCEWQVNHDVDLIFALDFLSHIEAKSKNRQKWFQPYRGSRVIYLSESESAKIKTALNTQTKVEITPEVPPLNYTPYTAGAPGGSVVVRWDDFQEMGGYDPELIFGYAPEDHMFWRKLEGFYIKDDSNLLKPRARSVHPFYSDDVFSHDSLVELLHLWHPPTSASKKYPFFNFFFAHYITNRFLEKDHTDWLELSKESYRS